MKKLIFLFFIVLSINGFTQNLINNPSFEEHIQCPNDFSNGIPDGLSYSTGWSSFRETPDYYDTCSTAASVKPPNCQLGFQYPHTGNAYAGFYTYYYTILYREFIGTLLTSPLVFKQKYYISFYVSLSGSISFDITIATNKIGVKFSTVPYSYSNPAPINNNASFYCNSIITDTLNWVKISGSFITDSVGYSYIIIGNFFNDSLTDTLNLSYYAHGAYYFIDDVCLSTDSLYCANWTGIEENSLNKKEKLVVYPNPAYDNIIISTKSNENISGYTISDLTGRIVINKIPVSPFNKIESDISALAVGTYIVNVATASNYYTLKFVKIK